MAEETTTEKKVATRKIKGDPVIWGVFIMLCIISINGWRFSQYKHCIVC